ncbi:MAG: dephospho-CoA kinase [Gemmatimonadaceae bacterium]|nr:dephospho-CoA kinase [Gemmatimonadaceae bacterium]
MLYVGLTGSIASGKSTVSSALAARGATLIDSDQLAREVVEPDSAGLAAIVERFGGEVLQHDGTLDRAAVRHRIFSDPAARDALNAIVHPAVRALRARRVEEARARGDRIVIADIPLLFELGLQQTFDAIIVVDASESIRRDRLVGTRGLGVAEAQAMINSQWPTERKRAGATWVIDNNGSLDDLSPQIASLWQALEARADTA